MKKIASIILLLTIILLANVHLIGCKNAESSEKKLTIKKKKLQELVDSTLDYSGVPGISVAVHFYNHDEYWTGVSGISHPGEEVNDSMLLYIGSNTKTFVGVLCTMMAAEGKLNLDDPIGNYLPTYTNLNPSITTRQLLKHQSGLSELFANDDLSIALDEEPNRIWGLDETLHYLLEPIAEPGTKAFYCSSNYIAAARIVEMISGKLIHELVEEYITTPLQLHHTYFTGFYEINEDFCHGYYGDTDIFGKQSIASTTAFCPSGTMASVPSDMVKFYNFLFNKNYLGKSGFNEFTSFSPWDYDEFYDFVGLGIYKVEKNGRTYYAHGGGGNGCFSFTLYDVETRNSIIAMCTRDFNVAWDLSYELAEIAAK